MKIHLIRHAEPSASAESRKDIDRALCQTGIDQASKLGLYLKEKGLDCEVWCSSALRTRQTWEILSSHVKFGKCAFHPHLYLCPKEVLLHEVWQSEGSEDLVLIGHNFGISDFISYLTDKNIVLSTCDYYCIDFGNRQRTEVSAGTGLIVDHYRP